MFESFSATPVSSFEDEMTNTESIESIKIKYNLANDAEAQKVIGICYLRARSPKAVTGLIEAPDKEHLTQHFSKLKLIEIYSYSNAFNDMTNIFAPAKATENFEKIRQACENNFGIITLIKNKEPYTTIGNKLKEFISQYVKTDNEVNTYLSDISYLTMTGACLRRLLRISLETEPTLDELFSQLEAAKKKEIEQIIGKKRVLEKNPEEEPPYKKQKITKSSNSNSARFFMKETPDQAPIETREIMNINSILN